MSGVAVSFVHCDPLFDGYSNVMFIVSTILNMEGPCTLRDTLVLDLLETLQ